MQCPCLAHADTVIAVLWRRALLARQAELQGHEGAAADGGPPADPQGLHGDHELAEADEEDEEDGWETDTEDEEAGEEMDED